MPEATVAAIIGRDKDGVAQVLLTRRNIPPFEGFWCLPGGHIDPLEHAQDAIVREVREETGLDFGCQYFKWFEEIFPEQEIHNIVHVFEGRASGTLQRDPKEVREICWLPVGEARSMTLAFGHHLVLKAYTNARQIHSMHLEKSEIALLREEVLKDIGQTVDVTKFGVTTATAIIAAGLALYGHNPEVAGFVFLLPLLLLAMTVEILINRRRNVMNKATYLRAFAHENFKWETYLREFRRREESKEKSSHYKTLLNIILLTGALACSLSLGAFWVVAPDPAEYPALMAVGRWISAGATITWIIYCLWKKLGAKRILLGSKQEDNVHERWLTMDDDCEWKNGTHHTPRE
jgi:8-oxo-dGTP diphosphatase